jgi:hypothetical protein
MRIDIISTNRLVYLVFGFLLFSSSSLNAQSRKISVSASQQPISQFLEKVQQLSNYSIVYSNEVVSDSIAVTFSADRMPVSDILETVLSQNQLFYKQVSSKMIVIGRKQADRNLDVSLLARISGRVTDAKDKAVPFASVGLMQGQAYLSGSISNENGEFALPYRYINMEGYRLRITSVGYQPLLVDFVFPDTAALKKLVLTEEKNTLQTVNVTAARPLIDRRADRYIVNVEGSMLADGNTGLEVLQRSPGVWVGNDGSIKIKGNQSVMVMINDVVQRMSESDLAEYLRTLRSEDISKIEIISSPPSEFEASGSGGIIHIVLKKARNEGLNGSVSTQYRQQEKRPNYGVGTSLDYKRKNLYLFGSISQGRDESDYIARTEISYPDQSAYASSTDRYNNNSRLFYRLGGVYDLSDKHSIGFQNISNIGRLHQFFDTDISLFGVQAVSGSANSIWMRKPSQNSSTLNYAWKIDSLGSGLKLLGDYVYSKKSELNNFTSQYSDPQMNSAYRNGTPNVTNLYSIQADFTKVFGSKLEFKSGLKYVSTERDNEVINEDLVAGEWVLNPGLSNEFIYKEDLMMAYASLEKRIKQTSIKAGLRAEQTYMNGNSVTSATTFKRDYFGLFPSLFVMQQLNEKKGNSMTFSYARRLSRPSFAYLNPYRLQFDDFLTQLGNPDLTPEYTNKFEIGSTLFKDYTLSLYYAKTTDKIAQLARPVGDKTIEYQPRNFNTSAEYGLSIDASVKIAPWWTTNNGLVFYNLAYNLDDFKIRQNTFYARSQHSIVLKDLFNVDVWLDYRSPYVSANTSIAYQFYAGLGMSKRILKNKGRVAFNLGDIFNTAREKDVTEYDGTRIDFYQKRPTRTFNLSLSYNFSTGKKFNNKKLEQSNEDEKSRIGN